MRSFLLASTILLALLGTASAQAPKITPVQQTGIITPGHGVKWTATGIIADAGTAANGSFTSLGVTNNGGPGICVNSAPVTGPYNQLCFAVATNNAGTITLQNYGGASPQVLRIIVNGVVVPFSSSGPGTVVSLTAGAGITLSSNPCTTSCTITSTSTGGVTSLTAGNANIAFSASTGAITATPSLTPSYTTVTTSGLASVGSLASTGAISGTALTLNSGGGSGPATTGINFTNGDVAIAMSGNHVIGFDTLNNVSINNALCMVGAVGGCSNGAGTINATGIYVNNVAVGSGGAGVSSLTAGNANIAFSASTGAITATPSLTPSYTSMTLTGGGGGGGATTGINFTGGNVAISMSGTHVLGFDASNNVSVNNAFCMVGATNGCNNGAGTINATAYYVNNVLLSSGGTAGVNTQTTSYSLINTDNNKTVEMNCASACSLFVPSSLNNNIKMDIVATGVGAVQVVASGTTVGSRVGSTIFLSTQGSGATLYNNAGGSGANVWYVVGDIAP